jgi:peptidoglycan/LPS O-acetylase OafA/YrhL
MDEKNKNKKLFAVIYAILFLPILSAQVAFIWTQDNALKGKLIVVAGLFLLIWAVFTVFYWTQIRRGFNSNPDAKPLSKFMKVSFMMFLLFYAGTVVSSFVQNHALNGDLLIVQGLILLVAIAFAGYDWILKRRERKRV